MLRSLTGVVKGPLALLLSLLLPWLPPRLPALAAPTAAAPVSASPVSASPVSAATEERMALYQKLAAVNYCVARSAGLADSQALPLAAQTIAVILRNEHGSRIARVGDGPLPGDALLQGSVELTLLGARQLCAASVPAESLAKLDARHAAERLRSAGDAHHGQL
ncbi:MAG: hypothetical protein ACK55X_08425 [Synechococcaceae cyanobacterium]|jgi:hypothetical protein